MTPTREMIKAVIEHPKTSVAVVTITGAERIWMEWGNWIVDALYSVGGLVLVCLLIYRNILSIKKDKIDKE